MTPPPTPAPTPTPTPAPTPAPAAGPSPAAGAAAPHLLVFGLGFTGTALALAARVQGWRASGTRRDPAAEPDAAALRAAGVAALAFHDTQAVAAALAEATHLVISIPPDDAGDLVLRRWAGAIAAAPHMGWIGYLSTTGVYGDAGGAWVDEDTPTRPSLPRTVRRLATEADWQALAARAGVALDIMRLAGIYGPGRSPLDAVRSGRAKRIERPGHAFSRIHRDDIVAALLLAMANPPARGGTRILNICDDEPAPQAEVVAEACRLLGVAPPPAVAWQDAAGTLSPMALSFWADNRRVSNARARAALGWRPRFPSYREGLAAVLAAEAEAGAGGDAAAPSAAASGGGASN